MKLLNLRDALLRGVSFCLPGDQRQQSAESIGDYAMPLKITIPRQNRGIVFIYAFIKFYLHSPKCFAIASQTSSLVSAPLSSLTIVKKPLSANSS